MAFGEETSTPQRIESLGYAPANGIRQGYTGYEKDIESGLEFAQARYYNSAHGRFTSVDPLTASANVKNPQTFNRYSYVLNSPYKFTDPLGLIIETTCCSSKDLEAQIRKDWEIGIKNGQLFKLDEKSLKKVVKALLPYYTRAAINGALAQKQVNRASPNPTKIVEQVNTVTTPGKVTQTETTIKAAGGIDVKIGGSEEAKAGGSTTGGASVEDSKKGSAEAGLNGQSETTTSVRVTESEPTVTTQTKTVADDSMEKAKNNFNTERDKIITLSAEASKALNRLDLTGNLLDTETNSYVQYNKPISFDTNAFDLNPRLTDVFDAAAKKAIP